MFALEILLQYLPKDIINFIIADYLAPSKIELMKEKQFCIALINKYDELDLDCLYAGYATGVSKLHGLCHVYKKQYRKYDSEYEKLYDNYFRMKASYKIFYRDYSFHPYDKYKDLVDIDFIRPTKKRDPRRRKTKCGALLLNHFY